MPGTLLFLSFFLFSRSQSRPGAMPPELLQAYREADAYYHRSLTAGYGTAADEALEERLNRIALQKFCLLEKRLVPYGAGADSLRFFLSLKAGELAHYFDSLSVALHYYKQAVALRTALPALADSLVFKPWLFSGQIYFYQNKWDSASYCFQQAEHILARYTHKIAESERLYNAQGVLYFQGGDYLQAGNYFRKAADMLERAGPNFNDFWVNYNINAAIALFRLENDDEAYSILQSLLPYRKHTNEIYNNLGLIEARKGRFQKAIGLYRKVAYHNLLDVGLENDKAAAWLALRQYDSARHCLQAALDKHTRYNGTRSSTDHGLTLKNWGDLEAAQHHYSIALNHYQKALGQFYPAFRDSSLFANPARFSGVFSYIDLFRTLVAKATAFHALYVSSRQTRWAIEELHSFEASFELIDYIGRTYESDEARLFLQKSRDLIHSRPVEMAVELYYRTKDRAFLEKAYQLDQRGKAFILALHDRQNQQVYPSSPARQEELGLKREITRLSLRAGARAAPADTGETSRRIRELEIRLGKIQEALTRTHPAVYVTVPSMATLQKRWLDPQTKLVSYHLGERKLTTFFITATGFGARQQTIYPGFFDDLEAFIRQLHHSLDTTAPADAAQDRLSSFLLKDLADDHHRRLIIIPDNELSYLPFEALKDRDTYLAENFSVQYQYSTSLLKKETGDLKAASTLSFAPFTGQGYAGAGLELEPLLYSLDEIRGLKGSSFTGKQATKKNFLEHMNGSPIIHLATHAVAGDDPGKPPFIAFAPWNALSGSDYLLYSQEIYDLSVKGNQLIILSACETGYGKLVKGEGIMSLSRAFAYAGCPNIITSLWKADDQATALLARKIHSYLREGLSIDEAVHRAKKDYLSDSHINPRMKQPAYWANMVFVGNYKAAAGSTWWIWMLSSAIPVAALCVLIRRCGRTKSFYKKPSPATLSY